VSYSTSPSATKRPFRSARSRGFTERARTLFQRIFANTPELIREAYRLRYQVYCVERQFENPAQSPDGLERDGYDRHSLHGILRHRATGTAIGTMRWILHKADAGARSFPLYEVCQDPRMRSQGFLPLERTAELSRFAISKEFRRRADDGAYGITRPAIERDNREPISNIALHLIAFALQIAFARGVEYGVAAMEPSLLRLLRRFALTFEPLGPLVQYHGWRQPCYAHVPSVMAQVKRERPEIWELVSDGSQATLALIGARSSEPARARLSPDRNRSADHQDFPIDIDEVVALPAVA
jgi:N-acyl amino acid synthase of PEP-CTERM/exosortase system